MKYVGKIYIPEELILKKANVGLDSAVTGVEYDSTTGEVTITFRSSRGSEFTSLNNSDTKKLNIDSL